MVAIAVFNQPYLWGEWLSYSSAYAQGNVSLPSPEKPKDSQLNLVAILVEQSLLDDKRVYKTESDLATLKQHVQNYADSIQKRLPHTVPFVVGVDRNESTYKIATTLEKLYFEGFDKDLLDGNPFNNDSLPEDDNRLAGVVIVGEVPLPVVQLDDLRSTPSVYPYVDFYQKAFVYDHDQQAFELHSSSYDPQAEIWHGVINPPKKDRSSAHQQLADFFDRNKQYADGKGGYDQFDQRILYADFHEIEKRLNPNDYLNYKRQNKYVEEVAFQRFNKHFLKQVVDEMRTESTDGQLKNPLIDDRSIASMSDSTTRYVIQKFMQPITEVFRSYLGQLNEKIESTGRWNPRQLDTPASLIALRDAYMQNILLFKTVELEDQIKSLIVKNQSAKQVVESVRLEISTCTNRTCTPVSQFDVASYIAGQKVSSVTSADQCGLYRGQERPNGVSIIDNNSVYAEANRVYNPSTALRSKGQNPLTSQSDYVRYGGCVGNNAISVNLPAQGVQLGPEFCNPDLAYSPVFDFSGSKEEFSFNPVSDSKNNFFAPSGEACSLNEMSFLQDPAPKKGDFGSAANQFFSSAVPGQTLAQVVNQVFGLMRSTNEISVSPSDPAIDLNYRLNQVLRQLLKGGVSQRQYLVGGQIIQFKAIPKLKAISGFVTHQEPSDNTIQATCSNQATFSIPADGVRYAEFYKDGKLSTFQYPNLFRLSGGNQSDVIQSMADLATQKDEELSLLIGVKTKVVSDFFKKNPQLYESILWRQLGVDQKHASILKKYLDKNEALPVVGQSKAPIAKPIGYEALYLRASGEDSSSFDFALNAKALQKKFENDPEIKSVKASIESTKKRVSSDVLDRDPRFKCKEKEGVEIWEWPANVFGCWIPEVIEKLDETITLSNQCSQVHPPKPALPKEDLYGKISDPLAESSSLLPKASGLKLILDKKVLGLGESAGIEVEVVDENGDRAWGYYPDPLEFTVNDKRFGELSKVKMPIYNGEGQSKFTAAQLAGKAKITVKLGELSASQDLEILKDIHVKLDYKKLADKPAYEITATLLNKDQERITGANTWIYLKTQSPSEGIFSRQRVKIESGSGQTIFFPHPTATNITISTNHSTYTTDLLKVPPIVEDPYRLKIKAPKVVRAGELIKIPVEFQSGSGAFVDSFDSSEFTPAIQVKITDSTKEMATLKEKTVVVKGGVADLNLKIGSETGAVHLVVTHPKLKSDYAQIKITSGLKSSDFDQSAPQSLFTAIEGFAAGDIFSSDYFAGTYLFAGKSQSVFSYLPFENESPVFQMSPYLSVKLDESYEHKITALQDQLSLEVVDPSTYQPVISGVLPFEFTDIENWSNQSKIKPNHLYFEKLHSQYFLTESKGAWSLYDRNSELVMQLSSKRIQMGDQLVYWKLASDSEFSEGLHLDLFNDFNEKVASVRMAHSPGSPKDLNWTIGKGFKMKSYYSGDTTALSTGISIYSDSEEGTMGGSNGFEGDQKYLLRFAGGSTTGESVRFGLPIHGILLGDPTVKLKPSGSSSLGYDRTIGRQIFEDPKGSSVVAMTHFDFNADQIQDVAALMKDGRVRLFEGGYTDPLYQDRGDIAYLADGAIDLISYDLKKDGYDDLMVVTEEGRLAILHNDQEVISRTNYQLKLGKKLHQIQKADFNQDGHNDLLTFDSRGDLKVFYHTGRVNTGKIEDQIPENGTLIDRYGFQVNTKDDLRSDLALQFKGLNPTVSTSISQKNPSDPYGLPKVNPPKKTDLSALKDFSEGKRSKVVSSSESRRYVQDLAQQADAGVVSNLQSSDLNLPWPTQNQSTSRFVSSAKISNSVQMNKTVEVERGSATSLDLESLLNYKITLKSSTSLSDVVVADIIPDVFEFDDSTVRCEGVGCDDLTLKKEGIYQFFGGLQLKANQPIVLHYQVQLKQVPKAKMIMKALTAKDQLTEAFPQDSYLDILVSPPYYQGGQLIAHYSTSDKTYKKAATLPSNNPVVDTAFQKQNKCLASLDLVQKEIQSGITPSQNTFDQMMLDCGLGEVQKGLNECSIAPGSQTKALTPQQGSGSNAVIEFEKFMQSVADEIAQMSCSGGGCFPIPYNKAFLAPGTPTGAIPLFSFPTTLPSPAGPIPVPSAFGSIPTNLGATNIPGTYNSLIRTYTIPTLTGGVGIAMCWGPYAGDLPVPPPLAPIPYPPPIGNCITFAVPMSDAPHCKVIEEGINKIMEGANAVISDISSGLSAINNAGLPVQLNSSTAQQGAGGLEIGLGINLGQSSKFQPPAQVLGNKRLGAFDSIGGVLSKWVDRQVQEISNKLLNLPTIRVIIPDLTLFTSRDWEEFNKLVTSFANKIAFTKQNSTDISTVFTNQKGGSPSDQFLNGYKTIEQEITALNPVSTFNDLYAIVNAMPLVNVTERHLDIKFPYLSYAEIQNMIRDFQDALLYYQKQLDRYKDVLEKYECPDTNAGDCAARRVLSAFVTDLDGLIRSLQANIRVAQSWGNLPKKVSLLHKELADYLYQTSCMLNGFSQSIGGWVSTLQDQLIDYAELYYVAEEIVKNYKKLFEVFINFENNANICTNERHTNFGWFSLLGLVLPDLPIINFPKWPDLVLDFSDIKGEIHIELPVFNFVGQTVNAPRIPRIEFPDLPNLTNLHLFLRVPKIPVLPAPPELPSVPDFPAVPQINLPTIPAAPKLPDINAELEVILPFVESILQTWTIIKKSFAPVPEAYLGDHITLLTNRPAYLTPIDLLKPEFPDVALFSLDFNEVRVETTLYLGIRLKAVWEEAAKAIDRYDSWILNEANNFDFSDLFQVFAAKIDQYVDDELEKAGIDPIALRQGLADYLALEEKLNQFTADLDGNIADFIKKNIESQLQAAERSLRETEKGWQKVVDEFDQEVLQKYMSKEFYRLITDGFAFVQTELDKILSVNLSSDDFNKFPLFVINKIIDQKIEGYDFGWPLENQEDREKLRDFLKTFDRETLKQYAAQAKRLNEEAAYQQFKNRSDLPDAAKDALRWLDEVADQVENLYEDSGTKDTLRGGDLSSYYKKDLLAKWDEIASSISKVNQSEGLSADEWGEKLDLPAVRLPSSDLKKKVDQLSLEFLNRSKVIENKWLANHQRQDLLAWADEKKEAPLSIELAQSDFDLEEVIVKRGFNPPKLSKNKSVLVAQNSSAPSSSARQSTPASVSCPGICLIDPVTQQSIPFISHFDQPSLVQMTFVPSAQPKKPHVIYSDGDSIYLKQNWLVDTIPSAPFKTSSVFELDDFWSGSSKESLPKSSIDHVEVSLVENGSSEFTWKPISHPDAYGYGFHIEKSALGYRNQSINNKLADVTVILLPPTEEGETPRVTVGEKVIEYGTLVTSLADVDLAKDRFGLSAENILLNSDQVVFRSAGDVAINLKENRAVYFDQLDGDSYRLNLENGFYSIQMTWFDRLGQIANYSQKELIAPQVYGQKLIPIDVSIDSSFRFPIFTPFTLKASSVLADVSEAYRYAWDLNRDGLPDQTGKELSLPGQSEPKRLKIDLLYSLNFDDSKEKVYKKTLQVDVYTPTIHLDDSALKSSGVIKGRIEGDQSKGVSKIPFSLLRKRGGVWKNLGFLKKQSGKSTSPELSDQFGWKDSFYSDESGEYSIDQFTSGDSSVLIMDTNKKVVAKVHKGTGQIEILDDQYELKVVPATQKLPTRFIVTLKNSDQILSNVYLVPDDETDVLIADDLSGFIKNSSIGVAVSDSNASDSIVPKNLPGSAPHFPGGVALVDEALDQNIALINTDGDVRMMKAGYRLIQKNKGQLDQKPILQIVSDNDVVILDLFIATNFDQLSIRLNETWSESGVRLAELKGSSSQFATLSPASDLLAQAKPRIPAAENPFSDVDESNPQYEAILNLYKRRIIKGYEDGSFKPEAKISRAEFVKVALGATNCFDCSNPTKVIREKYENTVPFPDVNLLDWFYFCVSIAKELKMVKGYGDGQFKPGQNISRAEAVAVLLRQSGVEITKAPTEFFFDVEDFAWYKDYVYTAVKIGLIKNQSGFVFPDQVITRGEFAFMADVVLNLQDCRLVDSDQDGLPDYFEVENGLDPLFKKDALLDFDNDGISNLDEYKNGTDLGAPDELEVPQPTCAYINNPNQSDLDGDGIIDACDDDIDNDGIKNELGIYDELGQLIPSKVKNSADNCLFVENKKQMDVDKNGVGDACTAKVKVDECPGIPEDIDGISDEDGCPDLQDQTPSNPVGAYVNKGPLCYFIDYENDLVEGDELMMAITDMVSHEIIYSQSKVVEY